MKASEELRINKLSDAAAKSELKANCEKFDSELGELGTLDGSADSFVSTFKWHGVSEGCRKIGKLIVRTHKNGDRSEWTNYRGISLVSLPGRVYDKMPQK